MWSWYTKIVNPLWLNAPCNKINFSLRASEHSRLSLSTLKGLTTVNICQQKIWDVLKGNHFEQTVLTVLSKTNKIEFVKMLISKELGSNIKIIRILLVKPKQANCGKKKVWLVFKCLLICIVWTNVYSRTCLVKYEFNFWIQFFKIAWNVWQNWICDFVSTF